MVKAAQAVGHARSRPEPGRAHASGEDEEPGLKNESDIYSPEL